MLICQHNAEFPQSSSDEHACDWSLAAGAYPELLEMPSFIAQQHQHYVPQTSGKSADPEQLQGRQLEAYTVVCEHFEGKMARGSDSHPPLQMVVSGTAGTGKSYLIECLKLLLKDHLLVAAPTGAAAYNVYGYTLHIGLGLPVKGDFKPLEGSRLQQIQKTLCGVDYLVIDEMSMIGRKVFGQVDKRLRQALPGRSEELFGGCSCILIASYHQSWTCRSTPQRLGLNCPIWEVPTTANSIVRWFWIG